MNLALFHLLVYLGDCSVSTWVLPLHCFSYLHGVLRHRQSKVCLISPSLTDTGYFKPFAIINKDAINTWIHTRSYVYTFYLQHKFLAVELLDQRVLNFKNIFGK